MVPSLSAPPPPPPPPPPPSLHQVGVRVTLYYHHRCMMMRKMMQRFHNSGAGGTRYAILHALWPICMLCGWTCFCCCSFIPRSYINSIFCVGGCCFSSSADQMEVDGTGEGVSLSMLQQLFSREYIQLYLRIASTATAQVS